MPKFLIRAGHAFRMPDGSLASAGEEIELASDVAALHAEKVAPLVDDAPADFFDTLPPSATSKES